MGEVPGPLVGPHELQGLLGVSRSRMRQLIRHPTFPEPFQRLHGTTVWLRADVEAWIAENRPPRPTDADPK
ncbi:helix-turn-helix transcriptional regulator [Micromonospora chalcea]|uniref:helix-turn-helix transcriptional regulator n=1 Tax=Micromonospora chalcea TaxID=1874 RepID=UPI0033CB0FFE